MRGATFARHSFAGSGMQCALSYFFAGMELAELKSIRKKPGGPIVENDYNRIPRSLRRG
jgi:hypothetical protein